MEEDVLVCACHHPAHHIIVQYDKEDKMVYLSVKLNRLTIWQRIKILFGYQIEYESVILENKHVNILNKIIRTVYRYE